MTLPVCDGKPCPRLVACNLLFGARDRLAAIRHEAAILAEIAVGVGYVVAGKVVEMAESARRRVGA